ncbi:MAG: hypothetical protein AABZ27_04770 [Candidatus Omnitrophota bacterium]
MEKKESADRLFSDLKVPSKGKLQEYFLVLLKLLFGACLLPIVYAVTVCFSGELLKLEPPVKGPFIWGIVGFILTYLFVWEPAVFFKKGQRILEFMFRFFSPLVKIAPFVLPIYTILLCLGYLILTKMADTREFLTLFIFGIGFSLALHLVFSAKTLRSKQGDKLKSNYIFGFSWIYILDALLLALFFNLAFENFSFLTFFNGAYQISRSIYLAAFHQLFL